MSVVDQLSIVDWLVFEEAQDTVSVVEVITS